MVWNYAQNYPNLAMNNKNATVNLQFEFGGKLQNID